jgi:hypothetical protein
MSSFDSFADTEGAAGYTQEVNQLWFPNRQTLVGCCHRLLVAQKIVLLSSF